MFLETTLLLCRLQNRCGKLLETIDMDMCGRVRAWKGGRMYVRNLDHANFTHDPERFLGGSTSLLKRSDVDRCLCYMLT